LIVASTVALLCAGGYILSQHLYLNGSAQDLTGYLQRLDDSAAPILATVLLAACAVLAIAPRGEK
jgi:hypothetical protein